jgi:hypothetical protein
MSAKSLLQDLLGELADLHEEAREMLADDFVRNSIVRDLGGTPSAATSAPQFPQAGLQSVKTYRDAAEPGLEALLSAIQDFRTYQEAIRGFAESIDLGPEAAVDEAYRAVLDILGWNLVRLRMPKLFYIMQALSFVDDTTSTFAGEYGGLVGMGRLLARVFDFAIHPMSWFDQSNFDDEHGVARITDRVALGGLLGVKLGSMGIRALKSVPGDNVIYGWDVVPGVEPPTPPTPIADVTLARTFTINFEHTNAAKTESGDETNPFKDNLVATLALIPRTQGGPGVFASFGGGLQVETQISDRWHFTAEMQTAGAVSVLIAHDPGFKIHAPDEGSDFRGVMAFEARPDVLTGKAFDLSLGTKTGLSAELVRFEGTLSTQSVQFRMQMLGGVASISPEAFDNFIAKILPKDGLSLNFDIGVGAASDRGAFYDGQVRSAGTGGGARPTTPPAPGVQPPPLPPLPPTEYAGPGFGLRIPIGKSLGPLTIHDLQLRVGYEDDGDDRTYILDAASSISTKIGPVMARVDRLGLRFGLRFTKDEKGERQYDDIDIGGLLPNGVALAIDAKGIASGGGFLYHDKVQQLYAGVMQLSLRERLTVKAFGLISTRMPDGSKGFSMIVFITVEDFQPIPIGMACTLRGIGGMIAIHRTFDEDAMRAALKNKTLGTLLFPKDPIRNAPEIIRNLVTCFPAQEGSYIVGVLMKLGWFSPTLVYLDIAVMIEFGRRLRVIVLGMISALLPTRENDLVRLNMDAMGVLDLNKGSVAIDAVLLDSRLAHKFVLTGSMALRANLFGRGGGFVMSVGGLNPRFAPPMGLPKLDRITIALASGNNPRLTCEAYFAITSNTIQFGARAQLYAAAYGFSVEGDVGFDVLVQLLPFHLIADFKASVQLKRGSRNLFKLSVEGSLEGPRPLRISGKASFEIFWCDFTIRFDKTLISGEKPPLPPAVDVLAELLRALTAPDSWSTQLPPNRQHGVTLRKVTSPGVLVLDPLGNLVVKQQLVPLNTSRDLDTFGGAPVAGARRFNVQARIEGVTQDVNPIQDSFAPAQFFSMTDDEKLASPSFQDMDAGVVFGSDAVVIDEGASLFAPLEFETIIIDEEGRRTQEIEDRYILIADRLFEQLRFGAVATSAVRRAGSAKFRNLTAPAAVSMRRTQPVRELVET